MSLVWVGCPFFNPVSLMSRFELSHKQRFSNGKGTIHLPPTPAPDLLKLGGQKTSEPSPSPQAADAVGEILLSLSYLPTAERLTVVVVKAKNLIWTNDKTTAGEGLCTQLFHEAPGSCHVMSRYGAQRQNPLWL